jgi:hypothetical protein
MDDSFRFDKLASVAYMTGIMDRAYETFGSTDMEHFSGGSRILFEAIHAVWSAASKALTGQTCHELLETFGSI